MKIQFLRHIHILVNSVGEYILRIQNRFDNFLIFELGDHLLDDVFTQGQ